MCCVGSHARTKAIARWWYEHRTGEHCVAFELRATLLFLHNKLHYIMLFHNKHCINSMPLQIKTDHACLTRPPFILYFFNKGMNTIWDALSNFLG